MATTSGRQLSNATLPLPDGGHLSLLYHVPVEPSPTPLPSLMFLPFWGGSANTFVSVLTSLASTQPNVISLAVSYPGTGSTSPDPSDNDPKRHSIPALTSDLLTALQTKQFQDLIPSRKIVIVAHSMSAKVACELMAALSSSSSEVKLTVKSLLLLAPAPPTPLILPEEMRQQQLTAYSTRESAKWTMQNVLTSRPLPEEGLNSLAADAAGMSEGAKRGWIEHGMRYDCSASLQSLSQGENMMPVQVLVGSEDKVETVERIKKETFEPCMAAGWDISMRLIDGMGHLLPVEAVDEVVEEIAEMLSSLQQTTSAEHEHS